MAFSNIPRTTYLEILHEESKSYDARYSALERFLIYIVCMYCLRPCN
jgi:hypothetical protein